MVSPKMPTAKNTLSCSLLRKSTSAALPMLTRAWPFVSILVIAVQPPPPPPPGEKNQNENKPPEEVLEP